MIDMNNPKRLIVGLTGTFGSGKSTVASLFKHFGAEKVVNADQLAHEVYQKNNPIRKHIEALFGLEGDWDRKQLAKIVFKDPLKRKLLERIIHPYVFNRMDQEVGKVKKGMIILEIPLLFETGADRLCDKTVAVVSGIKNIVERLADKNFTEDQVRKRVAAHFSETKKKKYADFIIKNMSTKQDLEKQTKNVFLKLTSILSEKS